MSENPILSVVKDDRLSVQDSSKLQTENGTRLTTKICMTIPSQRDSNMENIRKINCLFDQAFILSSYWSNQDITNKAYILNNTYNTAPEFKFNSNSKNVYCHKYIDTHKMQPGIFATMGMMKLSLLVHLWEVHRFVNWNKWHTIYSSVLLPPEKWCTAGTLTSYCI